MSDELMDCPFCGTSPKTGETYDKYNPFLATIGCPRCGYEILTGPSESWEKAKRNCSNIWNTRPIEDALRAKIEAAEARCKSALALYEEYHDVNIELRVENEKLQEQIDKAEKGNACLCPSCQNTAWNTCPQKQAECNYDMLQCGYVEAKAENERLKTLVTFAPAYREALEAVDLLRADNAKLKARVEAAENVIEAYHEMFAAIASSLEHEGAKLQYAISKWEALK